MISLEQYSVGINIVPTNEARQSTGNVIQIPSSSHIIEPNLTSNLVAIHKRSNIMLCHYLNYSNMEEKLYFLKQINKFKNGTKMWISESSCKNYGRPMSYNLLNTYVSTCQNKNKPILALSLEAYNTFLVITSAESVSL